MINQQSDCVSEYLTPLSQIDRLAKACHVEKPLRLAYTIQNYPNLTQNPRRVGYWEGSVSKTNAVDTKYKRELVDICRGRIISTSTLAMTDKSDESFDVRNPNLDPSISESFMVVPMTVAEAQSELSEAMHRCQSN